MTAGFFALVGVFYFRTAFGLNAAGAGLALAAFFVPFAVLQYPAGLLSDRIGRAIPVIAGSVCYGLGIVAVGLAPALWLAVAAMVAVGALGALVAPATMAGYLAAFLVVGPSEVAIAIVAARAVWRLSEGPNPGRASARPAE